MSSITWCHSRTNGNPVFFVLFWIPAFAGMTEQLRTGDFEIGSRMIHAAFEQTQLVGMKLINRIIRSATYEPGLRLA